MPVKGDIPEINAGGPVADSHGVGRRIWWDQLWEKNKKLRHDHFYDNREGNLSADWLGPSLPPSRKMVRDLTEIIDNIPNNVNPFEGWYCVLRRHIKLVDPIPVIHTPDDDTNNPFHVDIIRDDFRTRQQAYSLAASLLLIFNENGEFQLRRRGVGNKTP